MCLEDLGYSDRLEKLRTELDYSHFEIGRVIAEHKADTQPLRRM